MPEPLTLRQLLLRRRYKQWLRGHEDRLLGLSALRTDGDYLEGWYADPSTEYPEFLTWDDYQVVRDV